MAARPRLVGRKIGVERDRHDRNDVIVHQAAMHETEGMALAMRLGQALGMADVKLIADQLFDQMQAKLRFDRI